MTTTGPTPLQELIEGALREHAFVEHSPGAGEHIDLSPQAAKYLAARIAPIIAAHRYKVGHVDRATCEECGSEMWWSNTRKHRKRYGHTKFTVRALDGDT